MPVLLSRLLAAFAALALAAGVAGCGDESDESSSQPGTATSAESQADGSSGAVASDSVEIADFLYEPEAIMVKAGTTVTWTNRDDAAHTATSDDRVLDTDAIPGGEEGTITFDEPGTYSYFCVFHPYMEGSVVVE